MWVWDRWGLVLVEDPDVHRVSLFAAGDNIAHISVVEQAYDSENGTFDFSSIYSEVRENISSYDIAVVNQETVLIDDPSLRSGYPLFATPNDMGDALVYAGFDVILGATNHSYDMGRKGIENTMEFWKEKYPQIILLGMTEYKDKKLCQPN